jgi:transmembrane sensor
LVAFLFWAIPTYQSTSTISTLAAHRATATLADGTTVDLSAETELKTDFRYGRRVVHLTKGEAFFAVAKDPTHPFFVETAAGTVRVTGTHFNVRLDPESHAEVTLLEGAVRLEDTGFAPANLASGQQATLDSRLPVVRTLTDDELSNLTAWRKGLLVLDGLTLGQIAQRFSSYHGVTIVVDPSVADLQPAGTCAIDDLPQLFEVLKATKFVQVLSSPDGSYRIVHR